MFVSLELRKTSKNVTILRCKFWNKWVEGNILNIKKYIKEDITKDEALELFKLKGSKLMELFSVANEIRGIYCGNDLDRCTITNAKSGLCSENCKFCAQSSFYDTGIETYPLKDTRKLHEEYLGADKAGSSKFGIVTSGRAIKKGTKDFEDIKKFIEEANNKEEKVDLCVSIGLLNKEELLELQSIGLKRIHSNLQTSVNAYKKLVADTHEIHDRIETIKLAKEIGLDVCSGGIIGLGETWEDRIDMAFTLKDLNVDSIPINILTPIKGTPLGDMKLLDIDEILKTIAIYRIINKNKNIRIAAGRETRLKDFMGMAFMAGANGMLVGGYLTTKGRSLEDDVKFADDITKLWEQCID